MSYCPKCGTQNPDENKFCSSCGAPLVQNQETGYQKSYTDNPSTSSGQRIPFGFKDAIRVCMKQKYASFQGRAKRAEYWYFNLLELLITIPVAIIGFIVGLSVGNMIPMANFEDKLPTTIVSAIVVCYIFLFICGLVFLCPSISVLVRRLHDTGRSGWWYWIGLVPYVGVIVLLVFTLLSSQDHDNEYGPNILTDN